MARRDADKLRKFQNVIDEIRKVSPTYGPMDFTTGGSSKNHRPELRKEKGGKGALDMSFRANDITNTSDKVKIAKAIQKTGNRVGVAKDHLHLDDRKSPARVFKEDDDAVTIDIMDKLNETVNRKTASAEETARVASTPEGRKVLQRIAAQSGLPSRQLDRVNQQIKNNPEEIINATTRNIEAKEQGKSPSIKDSFMEALSFFAPQIGGMIVGGLIEGAEGAVAGGEQAGKLAQGFREYKLKKQEMELKSRPKQPSPLELEKLNVSKQNLEARQESLRLEKLRAGDLEEERDLRREERDTDRALKIKQEFVKRADISASKEQFELLNGMEDIIKDAPEIAAGVIPFKMAKGLAGEVGNLTNEEREAAQISPSFYRKLNRQGATYLTGRLPEADIKELAKVIKVIRNKVNARVRKKAEGYAKSRGKNLTKENQKFLLDDLLNENLSVTADQGQINSKVPSDSDIDNMSADELRKYLGER